MSGEKSCTTVRRRGCRLERKGLVEMAMDKMDVFLLRAHVVGHAHGGHKSTTQAAMHSQKKDGIRACEVRIRGSPRVCALRAPELPPLSGLSGSLKVRGCWAGAAVPAGPARTCPARPRVGFTFGGSPSGRSAFGLGAGDPDAPGPASAPHTRSRDERRYKRPGRGYCT